MTRGLAVGAAALVLTALGGILVVALYVVLGTLVWFE
jgi:hypothetical protein